MEIEQTNLKATKFSFLANKKFLIAAAIVLLLLAIAVAGYFIFFKKDVKTETPATASTDTASNTDQTTTNEASTTADSGAEKAKEAASNIVSKMAAVSIDQVSSAMGEINNTISSFNAAGGRR